MPVFDIPSERLADLTGADLRELIARLCEAERERQGGHRNEVRWGGSPTAADGGLDVVVEPIGSFEEVASLARRNVGIQVKKADLSPVKIKAEMRPGGALRPAISTLADQHGSYLIASAGANCSEKKLERRIKAMRDTVADDPNGAALHLAFLDRNAIGRWVSAHPSVTLWLRERLSLPTLTGWKPFGCWSSTPEGAADDLICKEGLVFHVGQRAPIRDLPVALDEIRKLVRDGTRAVRIVGLSGIGKSRIVQALFEEQVGSIDALPRSNAIYTDLGHSPDPAPIEMLKTLIASPEPAVLVVDNCPPDIHQMLARELVTHPGEVQLITVEYDVRTDRPEETDVIRVEADGPDIVEALLLRRHNDLSAGDARRFAELAQGNARLGFALAQAAPETGSLSAFEDAALFDRLFWQRKAPNEELARAAEVLSLIYSFDVSGEEEPDELAFLGSLAELSRTAMYRYASTLLDRGLAQARSRWRAVLPHALANRLARQALKTIPFQSIADNFADKPRLRRSLARRLSYLHDCTEAKHIVIRWMEAGGPLHGSTPDFQVLEVVCHLVPDGALRIVDGMIAGMQAAPENFLRLDGAIRTIKRIAHFEDMFSNACESLVSLAITVGEQSASNLDTRADLAVTAQINVGKKSASDADNMLIRLFRLRFSGTLARTETRIQAARKYLISNDPNHNSRVVHMLESALRTEHWLCSIILSDDARPDALGWEPCEEEIEDWFSQWLDLAADIDLNGSPEIRDSVRNVLADKMTGIWLHVPSLRAKVGQIARQLHDGAPWMEGWYSFKQMLNHTNRKGWGISSNDMATVRQFIDDLAPTNLTDRVRAEIVEKWSVRNAEGEDYQTCWDRRVRRLERLGQELAASPDVLASVEKDLFARNNQSLFALGVGLAQGSEQPERIWVILREPYLNYPNRPHQANLISGFLHYLDKSNPSVAEIFRVDCRSIPALRRIYPVFLPRGALSAFEFENIINIASEQETNAQLISEIAWCKYYALDDRKRVRLLRMLLGRQDGPALVVNALNMLIYIEKDSQDAWPEALRIVGLDAITTIISNQKSDLNIDTNMVDTLLYCLHDENSIHAARIMDAIIDRDMLYYLGAYDFKFILVIIAMRKPHVFLSKIFPDGTDQTSIKLHNELSSNPLMHVSLEALIVWCRKDTTRWLKVARNISPFFPGLDEDGRAGRIYPLAIDFLKASPNTVEVVEAYLQHLYPMSWSGSQADIMAHRLKHLETLGSDFSPEVGQTIARLAPDACARIAQIRNAEAKDNQERSQRFE